MEYIVPLVLTIIGIIMSPRLTSETPKRVWAAVIFLYMILLMGLRYRVGMDTLIYMNNMDLIPPIDTLFRENIFSQVYEPAYILICSICKYFTRDFWPIQIVMNAIMMVCVYIFLVRTCKNIFLGIFVFILLKWLYFSTEIMREGVAIGFFLVNYKNFKEKKWLKYYLFSIFSISFHYSAVLIWFLPLVKNLRPNWLYVLFCVGILAITPVVESLNKLVNLGLVTQKITTYVDQAEILDLNWRLAEMIKTGFPALVALIMYRASSLKNKMESFVLLQFLFCCGAFAIPVIFQRFANYTSMFVVVSLANYLSERSVAVWLRGCVIGALCMSQAFYYYTMFPTWFPYVSVFDAVKVPAREEYFRIVWKVK